MTTRRTTQGFSLHVLFAFFFFILYPPIRPDPGQQATTVHCMANGIIIFIFFLFSVVLLRVTLFAWKYFPFFLWLFHVMQSH